MKDITNVFTQGIAFYSFKTIKEMYLLLGVMGIILFVLHLGRFPKDNLRLFKRNIFSFFFWLAVISISFLLIFKAIAGPRFMLYSG